MSDDLVITPSLGIGPSPAVARLRRMRASAARAQRRGAVRRRHNLRGMRLAFRGILSLLGQVDGMDPVLDAAEAMRLAARGGPMGWVALGIVVGSAVTARLESGRSFENMMENLRESVVGDLDNAVNAARAARGIMEEDFDLRRVIRLTGSDNPQVQAIFRSLYQREKRMEDARQVIMRDKRLQVNGPWDVAIVGGTRRLGEVLYGKPEQRAVREFGGAVRAHTETARGR